MKKFYLLFIYILFIAGLHSISFGQYEDSVRYLVRSLPINSKQSDFSPFLFNKKLYFASGRDNDFGVKFFTVESNQELIDVFTAEKIDSITFKKPKPFTEVNTKFNDGPICISKDGKQLFISKTDLKRGNGTDKKPLSIFVSHKTDKGWSEPEVLPFCNLNYSYCHPALTTNGTLIFSSDISGGYGGMDLYYSKFENGTWTIPRNYGPKINGKENEVFPFVSVNNMLYFSTNRKNGFGGLDIYSFNLKKPTFSQIQILEAPLNSPYDDFGIWVDSTERMGYLSSNRDSLNSDDIFYFKNKYPDFEKCNTQKRRTYCFTFFEEATQMSADTLGMTYEWDFGDGAKKRGIEVKHCYAKPGNYAIQLNVIEKASGNLFYNELSYDFEVEEPKQFYIACADTIATGKPFIINTANVFIPKHSIKEIFYFFGDGKFNTTKSVQHTYKKDGEYVIRLGAIAQNDSTGEMEKLCVQKTVLVKDSLWIVRHKPDPRIKLNSKVSGSTKKDSVNYRVHLGSSKTDIPVNAKVFNDLHNVKQYKEKDGYTYTSGYAQQVADAIPEYRKAKEKGFKDASVVSFKGDSLMPNQQKSMKGSIANAFGINALYKLNIFFDVNSAVIHKSEYKYLDSLAGVLKKDKHLELIVLTAIDAAKEKEANFELSNKRGAAIQSYFKSRGIKSDRLDINALGKNMPTEYEDGKNVVLSNRRAEILLVKTTK